MGTALGVGLLILGLVGCGGIHPNLVDESKLAPTRPSHHGLALPYPWYLPKLNDDVVVPPGDSVAPLAVELTIDTSGLVMRAITTDPDRQGEFSLILDYLLQARFEPGLRNLVPDTMTIPALLAFPDGDNGQPSIAFPVGPDARIHNFDLYWEAMALHGYAPAELVSFPSYYYEFTGDNPWQTYPIIVLRVEIDSTGDMVGASPVMSTYPNFVDQLAVAANWARYRPARTMGEEVASSAFLVVSLFPMVDYPADPLEAGDDSPDSPWDRWRIRLVPDTTGLLIPPVPKQTWSGPVTDRFHQPESDTAIEGYIAVDRRGRLNSGRFPGADWKVSSLFATRSRGNSFFPSRDLNGNLYARTGKVKIVYTDKSNVRIRFDWYPVEFVRPNR